MANIIVKNTTNYARTGLVTVGVPFSRAFDLRLNDVLVVNNAKTGVSNLKVQWYNMGPALDSGAFKYARVTFEVDLTAYEEKIVTLTRATGSTSVTELPYVPSNTLLTGLIGANIQLNIEGRNFTIPMSQMLQSGRIEGFGNHDFYRRFRYFSHFPDVSDPRIKYLWTELVVDVPARLNQCNMYFRYGFYRFYPNMENAAGIDPVFYLSQDITLNISGPKHRFRWEDIKVPGSQEVSQTVRNITLVNRGAAGSDRFAAGSSNAYSGVFCFTNTASDTAELLGPILAIAEDWKDPSTYPITGVMPPRPSYITDDADALSRSENLRSQFEAAVEGRRNPYTWPGTCNNPTLTDAGAHGYRDYAYGMRGWPFLSTANYNWIPLLKFTTQQQSLRHNWYYGTNGQPVPPADFLAAQVRFWNGTFNTTSEDRYRGFNRQVTPDDCARDPQFNRTIFGPDKEHFTNKLFIIQHLVSPDWISLEYVKMYTNYFIYANRTDAYFWAQSDVEFWGAPRGAGRGSECLAFLYEASGNEVIRYWSEQRLNYALADNRSRLLNKTLYPGGPLTKYTASQILEPNPLPNGLASLEHGRPWEDAQLALGLWLLGKAFLNSNPTDAHGLKCIELAKDISGSIAIDGHLDGRPSANRKFIGITFATVAAANAFLSSIGGQLNVVSATTPTGGYGLIYLYCFDLSWYNPVSTRSIVLFLKNTVGTFTEGEVITLATGPSATITRVYGLYGGNSSRAITSPSNGFAGILTENEKDEILPLPILGFNPAEFPVGFFKYARWSFFYFNNLMAAFIIARLAARDNYYANGNAEIIAKADDIISYLAEQSTDNGDYSEDFWSFAGYLEQDPVDNTSKTLVALPLRCSSVLNTTTVSVVITVINATAEVRDATNTIQLTPGSPRVKGTTGTQHATIAPFSTRIRLTVPAGGTSGGASVTTSGVNTITFSASNVDEVYVTNTIPGRRLFSYVYIGTPDSEEYPSFVSSEVIPPQPSGSTIQNYHRTLALNTIVGEGLITDYVLVNPITTIGLLGEAVGLNGQTLGSQGFTWALPSAITPYDLTTHVITTSGVGHIIDVAARGGAVRSWSVSQDDSLIQILYTNSVTNGIVMEEVYDTNVTSDRKIFNPNFLGAQTTLSGNQYIFVSPNRLVGSVITKSRGKVFDASVTPLEKISYANPYQNLGGSVGQPAIARDMKMYYNLASETVIDGVSQLDSWIYHPVGIPFGDHNLSGNVKLDLRPIFNQMLAYNIELDTYIDISELLLAGTQKVTLGMSDTKVTLASGAIQTLPSFMPGGKGAIILANTQEPFVMAMVAGLDTSSDDMQKITHLTLENTLTVGQAGVTYHSVGVSSINNYDPDGNTRRISGWIGRRMYLAYAQSYIDILSKIQTIHESTTINSTIDSKGLYLYERPAII